MTSPDQRFAKCGPQVSSSSLTWTLVRNVNSWAESETLRVELKNLYLPSPLDDSDVC